MKDFKTKMFIFFYCSFLLSCRPSVPSATVEFNEFLKMLHADNKQNIDAYLILPVNICPSCIDTYKSYIKDTLHTDNVLFIVSGNSLKKLRLTFGTDVLEMNNVIIDKAGIFYNTVFYKENAQIFFRGKNEFQIREIFPNNLKEELLNLTKNIQSKKPPADIRREKSVNKLVNDFMSAGAPSFFSHLIGKELPIHKFNTIRGLHFNSSEFIGKPMVLNFWFLRCPNCYEEIPDLNSVYEDSKKEDFVFMSFCKDEIEEIKESFEVIEGNGYKRKRSKRMSETMYYDIVPGANEIIDSLKIKAFPVTLIVGEDGKVTNAILFTKLFKYPDEMITYRVIKAEIEKIKKFSLN